MNTDRIAASERKDEDRPATDGGKSYAAIAQIAGKALELAETHKTPPVPKTYEVWYAYASGGNPLVADRIDALLDKGGSIGPYDVDQIHGEFLSLETRKRSQIDQANARLEKEMDEILDMVQVHLASSATYSGSLDMRAEALKGDPSPAAIRKTVGLLLEENRAMRAETAKLSTSLENTKAQIKELRSSLEESRENEMRDPLTGIANRRRFDDWVAEETERARSEGKPLCLVLADIDHFKRINDKFGHMVGDEVIKYFANLLSRSVKGDLMVARIGGEEFAILLPGMRTAEAERAMEQLRLKLRETKFVITENRIPIGLVTASFGIGEFSDYDDVGMLRNRADRNLYLAKRAGRNRVVSGIGIIV